MVKDLFAHFKASRVPESAAEAAFHLSAGFVPFAVFVSALGAQNNIFPKPLMALTDGSHASFGAPLVFALGALSAHNAVWALMKAAARSFGGKLKIKHRLMALWLTVLFAVCAGGGFALSLLGGYAMPIAAIGLVFYALYRFSPNRPPKRLLTAIVSSAGAGMWIICTKALDLWMDIVPASGVVWGLTAWCYCVCLTVAAGGEFLEFACARSAEPNSDVN